MLHKTIARSFSTKLPKVAVIGASGGVSLSEETKFSPTEDGLTRVSADWTTSVVAPQTKPLCG